MSKHVVSFLAHLQNGKRRLMPLIASPDKLTNAFSNFLQHFYLPGSSQIPLAKWARKTTICSHIFVQNCTPLSDWWKKSFRSRTSWLLAIIHLSGNTVWPKALGFSKTRQNGLFLAFLTNFCPLKMSHLNFSILAFFTIFCRFKIDLATLFDCKLQVFKNSSNGQLWHR